MDETDVLDHLFSAVYEDYKTRLNKSVASKSAPKSEVEPKDVNEWMREQEVKSKALDALFNPDATMAVPSSTIVGKSVTTVWYDDPWNI